MGVFEQQHCNYEQVFGQAFVVGAMCTAVPATRQPNLFGPSKLDLSQSGLDFQPFFGLGNIFW